MAEQCLSGSTDIPSTFQTDKNKSNRNSRILTSSFNQSSSSASSTASLTIYCIETGSVAQSVRRRQSMTNTTITPSTYLEMTTTIDNNQQQVLADVEKTASFGNSDTDSFNSYDGEDDDDDDDDDETIINYSLRSQSFLTPANHVRSQCPICFEQAVLQVSPCCYFLCCNNCWRAHISATINDRRIKIPCVSSDCTKFLTRESIVNYVRYDQPLHDRYLKLYVNANQNPRARTCPRCCHLYCLDTNSPLLLSNKNQKKTKKADKKIPKQVQCSECSLVWCFRCSAPWHENLTCKQFVKGDKLLKKWINQKNEEQWNARKCPKCSSLIQRAGGCPHMTCQSCSCEFCYLCGRRYMQIPLIGQHSNKYSVFGCPYNLHPEKPWLRRTIRGMIATGIVITSPILVAGAVTAAITVLPPLGIYKVIKRVRTRRQGQLDARFPITEPVFFETDMNDPHILTRNPFQFDFTVDLAGDERGRVWRQRLDALSLAQTIIEDNEEQRDQTFDNDFPLSIFSEMEVEHLFDEKILSEDVESMRSPSDFRTCPTTPAFTIRKGCSRSLNNLFDTPRTSINRQNTTISDHS